MWNTGVASSTIPSTGRDSRLEITTALKDCITTVRDSRALSAGRPQTETTNTRVLSTVIISLKEKVQLNAHIGVLSEPLGIYEGDFVNGEKHGEGYYKSKNGTKYRGQYRHN